MKHCTWSMGDDGIWDTGCGEKHVFETGGPAGNHYAYCPYCGCPIDTSHKTDNMRKRAVKRVIGLVVMEMDGVYILQIILDVFAVRSVYIGNQKRAKRRSAAKTSRPNGLRYQVNITKWGQTQDIFIQLIG